MFSLRAVRRLDSIWRNRPVEGGGQIREDRVFCLTDTLPAEPQKGAFFRRIGDLLGDLPHPALVALGVAVVALLALGFCESPFLPQETHRCLAVLHGQTVQCLGGLCGVAD